MKFLNKLLLSLFTLFLIVISCKNKEKEKTSTQQDIKKDSIIEIKARTTNSLKQKIAIDIKDPRAILQSERHRYTGTFKIYSSKDGHDSYFDSEDKNTIKVKIGVPNINFRIYGVYNISQGNKKGIVILVTDGTTASACGSANNFILEETFLANTILDVHGNSPLSLENTTNLNVIVFNEDKNSFKKEYINVIKKRFLRPGKFDYTCRDYRINKAIVQPKQGGGGIIVGIP
ncbi:hypothetical protein [Polaribacter sp.]|uniref:hypothetical protein n=1 Tax=Polaribacter sp. TaxID=1920175 RepID=UPI003EF4605A